MGLPLEPTKEKTVLRSSLLFLFGLAFTLPAVAAAGLEERVDALIEPYVDLGMFNGVVLIADGDHVVLEKGYGMASYEHTVPNRPSTRFRIASISKEFTALAIGKLVQQERLDWERPLSEILPEFPNADSMTIRQLVDHTAGLDRLHNDPNYELQMTQRHTLEQLLGWLGERPLLYEPGTSERYSSSYLVLALVVERVAGEDFGRFLQREILRPLGLESTAHEEHDEIVAHLASGYVPGTSLGVRRKATYFSPDIKTGSGSLYSSARDLYRFATAWHQNSLFSPGEWTDLVGPTERAGKALTLYLQGRQPGYFSHLRKDHDSGLIVVILSNNYAWVAWPSALTRIAKGEGVELPAYKPLPEPLAPATADRVEGTWAWPDGDLFGLESEGGQVFYRHLTRGTRVLLPWLSEREFLFTMFDLICSLPTTDAPARFECRSHWHDETLSFERTEVLP